MKKVKVLFFGATYEEVKDNYESFPKWEFTANKELECVILERKQLTSKKTNSTFLLFTVAERRTKKKYSIIPNSVLGQRLGNIPDFAAVKIVFTGVVPPKNYHNFSVFNDTSFKFNPNEWTMDELKTNYTTNKNQSDSTDSSTVQHNANLQQSANNVVDDDLPF